LPAKKNWKSSGNSCAPVMLLWGNNRRAVVFLQDKVAAEARPLFP
jgi:hypothetical protein